MTLPARLLANGLVEMPSSLPPCPELDERVDATLNRPQLKWGLVPRLGLSTKNGPGDTGQFASERGSVDD
jgi:hypothetical protein